MNPDTELTLDFCYNYRPSKPIDVPPPPTPTLCGAFKYPHFPNIEQTVFKS